MAVKIIPKHCLGYKPVHPNSFFLDWLESNPPPVAGTLYFKQVEDNNDWFYENCPEYD